MRRALYANHFCWSDRYPSEAGDLVSLPPGVEYIYFDGIVSNPLDAKQQVRKHIALDAMCHTPRRADGFVKF